MDIPMTTYNPPCINPFRTEEVRFIDNGKNASNLYRSTDSFYHGRRSMITEATTSGKVAIYNAEVEISKFDVLIQKYKGALDSFLELQEDWDSYGSLPPSFKVINKSHLILNSLNDINGKLNIVYPLNNGVQIDFNTENFKYEIEVYEEYMKLIVFSSDEEYLGTREFNNITMFNLNDHLC